MYKEYHPYKRLLLLADVVVTLLILGLMVELRPYLPGREVAADDVVRHPVAYMIVALFLHALFASTGVYDLKRIPNFQAQFGRFTTSYVLSIFMLAGFLFFSHRDTSRMLLVYFAAANYVALLTMRYLLALYLRYEHRGLSKASTLIVGTSPQAAKPAETLRQHHHAVLDIVGFAGNPAHSERLPYPVLGTIEDVPQIVRDMNIQLVVIAAADHTPQEIKDLIGRLESLPVRVYIIPDIFQPALVYAEVETFGDVVAIGLREPAINGHRRVAKRILDMVLSAVLLMFIWPLLIAIWAAVRLDSPGPAIFTARRVGQNGRLFDMYKFRTMVVDANKQAPIPAMRDDHNRPVFKVKDDPRVTRLGRILRRTSLDELPQLINVLKGEMSLVGPRPEQPFIAEHYDQWQWRRLSVPPGITGWWQVNGRSDLAMHLNSDYDIFYVRNYSFLLDLRILFRTIGTVIRGKGAY